MPRGYLYRRLTFSVGILPPPLLTLLSEYRLIVNQCIRIAVMHDIRSGYRLSEVAYARLCAEHVIHKSYILSAFAVALGVLKPYRRRLRRGLKANVPYVHRPMLMAESRSYWVDRETGRIRIALRGTEGIQLVLPMSQWHRSFLSDPSWILANLSVTPEMLIITVKRRAPTPYVPAAAIALDTNEESLDGLCAGSHSAQLVTVPLDGVRRVQSTHFRRRRRLARKKSVTVA